MSYGEECKMEAQAAYLLEDGNKPISGENLREEATHTTYEGKVAVKKYA